MYHESVPFLLDGRDPGLSVFFATLCIVDIFGVFPILALPRAIVQCGYVGIPLFLVVFGLQVYTAVILGKSWTIAASMDPQIPRKNRYPLAAVTELTLGPRARLVVTLLLDLAVFAGGIPNLLVASQNLQIFGSKVAGDDFNLSFCYWLLVVGVLLSPFVWLGSPRDMKWLAVCSCSSVVITAALTWWCILADDRLIDVITIPASSSWDKFIAGYGMLAFQFDIHPTLMTIQVDMQRPRDISKAVISSFLVSGGLFAVTTAIAVGRYGGGMTANVLEQVPPSVTVYIAILLAALQLCLSSAIGHSALFQHIEDQLHIPKSFTWRRCALRSAVVLLGVAIGESVPRFDVVMALIGGTLNGPLIFILPPLLYARALALKGGRSSSASSSSSSTEGQRTSEEVALPMDSRIHSRSSYYGFVGGTAAASKHPCRYSYAYYENLEGDSDTSRNAGERRLPTLLPFRERRILQDLRKSISCFGCCILLFGLLITASSTYINVKNTARFVHFTPPCIVNATAASG